MRRFFSLALIFAAQLAAIEFDRDTVYSLSDTKSEVITRYVSDTAYLINTDAQPRNFDGIHIQQITGNQDFPLEFGLYMKVLPYAGEDGTMIFLPRLDPAVQRFTIPFRDACQLGP
jgi:hypothetical protein